MKHLFFVAVSLGIFSGTSTPANAQSSAGYTRMRDDVNTKKHERFIESIAIKNGPAAAGQPMAKKNAEMNTTSGGPAMNTEPSIIESCSAFQFKYAQIMDIDVESVGNNPLFNFIDKWWATDYLYGGTTKKGIDCSAYTSTLLHDVYKTDLPRTSKSQYQECEKIAMDDLREGDLVFFNTRKGVSHVGVYLKNGYFTHASVGEGVTISNLEETYYNQRFISGGRIATGIVKK